MIDTTTGELALGATTIGPRLTLGTFRAAKLSKGASRLAGGGSWQSFDVGKHTIGEALFSVTLRFDGEKLSMVSMAMTDANEPDDDAWSEKAAHAAKKRHDHWLAKALGSPPYEYEWGRVESTYDPRSVSSGITVTYVTSA
jgi:hypothetical protein